MEAGKCRAYNKARQSELCAQATVIDSALDPLRVLKVLIEGLDEETESGIYLKNFSGIPVAGALSSFDLVYLDKSERVMDGVALSPDFEAMPFTGRAASALVLPSGTLARSRTMKGDALIVTVVKEAEDKPVRAGSVAKPAEPAFSTDWLSRDRPLDALTPAGAKESKPVQSEADTDEAAVVPRDWDIALKHAEAVPEAVESVAEGGVVSEEAGKPEKEQEAVSPVLAIDNTVDSAGIAEEAEARPRQTAIGPDRGGETEQTGRPVAASSEDEQLVFVFADEVVGEPEVVSVESLPASADGGAKPETEAPVLGEGAGKKHVELPQAAAFETKELEGKADSLEADLRRLVTQRLDEVGKAGSRVKEEPLEQALRRLVSARGSRLKRIRLWTSSVLAKGFSGSPARTRAIKAAQLGPVDWVGDQPRRAIASGDSAAPQQQQPAVKEALKIRFLRRIDYFLRWLNYEEDLPQMVKEADEDQRRGERMPFPNMIAFFWTGGVPKPYKIGNISVSGFYLMTDERWSPGTVIRMTLQRGDLTADNPRDAITVFAKVVRWGPDGEGFEFVLTKLLE